MKTVGQVILAFAVLIAVFAGGCGSDSCPTESPEVRQLSSNCTAVKSTTVNYPIALCPTCNQNLTSCDAQISGTSIFLNPVVEACSSSSSCGQGCSVNADTCTFTAPATAGTYQVSAFDAAHPGVPRTGTLQVIDSGTTSCTL